MIEADWAWQGRVWSGWERPGSVRQARLDSAVSGRVRLGVVRQARYGCAGLGSARLGPERLGSAGFVWWGRAA